MVHGERKTILIGGVGLSPAVLSNTAWALAHEPEPVIPDEVLAITTLSGKTCIQEQLIDSGAWDRLSSSLAKEGFQVADRLAFGSTDSIRVIGDGKIDFNDIATPEQNTVAADFILKVLRQYSEDPGTQVIASIAGGRYPDYRKVVPKCDGRDTYSINGKGSRFVMWVAAALGSYVDPKLMALGDEETVDIFIQKTDVGTSPMVVRNEQSLLIVMPMKLDGSVGEQLDRMQLDRLRRQRKMAVIKPRSKVESAPWWPFWQRRKAA